MNHKIITQVCFSLKTGLTMEDLKTKLITLRTKLTEEFGNDGYEVRSCHLSRELCIEKGFGTEVPDLFDEIFGDKYTCELAGEKSFDEAMKNLNDHREQLSISADKLVILSSEALTNVALELQLFTQNQVMVL